MNSPFHQEILGKLIAAFDVPIMQNNLRGMYVEYLVSELLGDDWQMVGSEWSGWDIQHATGTRVEVKQSAALQTWKPLGKGYSAPRFSIRSATGYWSDGSHWTAAHSRIADLYIFAWHGVSDESADQRDPSQWTFYILPSAQLPEAQKSIGLNSLSKLATPLEAAELKNGVDDLRSVCLAREKTE